jgi:hypothetical protein
MNQTKANTEENHAVDGLGLARRPGHAEPSNQTRPGALGGAGTTAVTIEEAGVRCRLSIVGLGALRLAAWAETKRADLSSFSPRSCSQHKPRTLLVRCSHVDGQPAT